MIKCLHPLAPHIAMQFHLWHLVWFWRIAPLRMAAYWRWI